MVTARRVAVVAAGCLGAEFLGGAGYLLGASLLTIDLAGPALAGLMLAPVLAAAGGPVGYDMATTWAADDERAIRAAPGARAAVHLAGVAVALFGSLVLLLASAAAPTAPTVYLILVAMVALPMMAVAGRRWALRFASSSTLLPMSIVATVVAALGLLGGFIVWLMRMFDAFGTD